MHNLYHDNKNIPSVFNPKNLDKTGTQWQNQTKKPNDRNPQDFGDYCTFHMITVEIWETEISMAADIWIVVLCVVTQKVKNVRKNLLPRSTGYLEH